MSLASRAAVAVFALLLLPSSAHTASFGANELSGWTLRGQGADYNRLVVRQDETRGLSGRGMSTSLP